MPASERITNLIQRPAESLNVEIKTWIDPREDEGIGKLVKGMFAIRNRNGGYLAIGFNNGTLEPDPYPYQEDVEELFHIDVVQGIASRYASRPFEVSVEFPERDGQRHPVIIVPEGVVVPVVVKSDLNRAGGGLHLRKKDIYFRTLDANGTASSATVGPRDIADLVETCFDNREADIGRFIRRQLGSMDASGLGALIGALTGPPPLDLAARAAQVIEEGETAFQAALAVRPDKAEFADYLQSLTMHVGLVLDPPRDALPTQEFMNKVAGGNPQFTGWPVWLDARSFNRAEDRAVVRNGAWETLIADKGGWVSPHFEFMRLDPRGEFYLRRAMQDDLAGKVTPGTALDVVLMLYRVAEVLAVGISIARAVGWEESTRGQFAFKWTGLEGRQLRPWSNVLRPVGFGGAYASSTGEVSSSVELTLDTPHAALAPYLGAAVAPLFAAFGGFEASTALLEDCVKRLIDRNL